MNSDITPTIGTTVTIRGIGGIGKSTITKALCHDPLIKEHFINGFLWISLTPPLPNPMTMLSEIYQRLTGKLATTNLSVLKNEIKLLVSSPSCRLLVILDDVWEAKDAMMFVDMFSSCKVILTTRKMDINGKIPPKLWFDIKPMTIDEALQLLTLQIIKIDTLHATDVSRIQELARDLHCWPLLLNLVHGQLYAHCIEWNRSPQDAILEVQQKLFDNGLTAFDPEDQLEASRENAVRASITASLQLLNKNEEIILFYIASSIVGIGMYCFIDVLKTILQMDLKQFDKYTRNLWCHGLISFQDLTFPNIATKIPCIGMHEVIAHYINENVPEDLYVDFALRGLTVFKDVLLEDLFSYSEDTNIGQSFLTRTDAIVIPFWIRFTTIYAKSIQALLFRNLNTVIEKNIHLLENNDLKVFNHNFQFPVMKHLYKTIEQDCNTIHSLLADGNYNDAVTWAKQYFVNHPLKLTFEAASTYFNSLLNSSESNFSDVVTSDIKTWVHGVDTIFVTFTKLQRHIILNIIAYIHILHLLNAAVSYDDIKYYFKCSTIF